MFKTIVQEGQRALLYADGRLIEVLRPGAYRRWGWFTDYTVGYVTAADPIRELTPAVEKVIPSEDTMVVDVPADHAALVRRAEKPYRVLQPGRWIVWLLDAAFDFELVALTGSRTELPVDFWPIAAPGMVMDVLVHPFERAIIYVDGDLAEVLGPGRHGLCAWNRNIQIERVDLREQELQVVGQELITADKVSLRLNTLAKFRVTDPVASVQAVTDLRDALYAEIQMVTRGAVAGVTVDALLEQRVELARAMIDAVADRAKAWGIEVLRLEIKDVILPGDMKVLLNKVIEAEKRAAAQVILRREEVAATRSLANTARMLENNPVLVRLKEAETWKDIAERIPNLTVVVSPNQLQQQLRIGDD